MESNGQRGNEKVESGFGRKLKFECPFTWEMDSILKLPREKKEKDLLNDDDDDEFFPFLNLMRKIMMLFVGINTNSETGKILEIMKKCDKDIEDLIAKPHAEISLVVAKYVLRSTKFFIYQKIKMVDETNVICEKLIKVNFASKKEKSTLIACRAICWSNCYEAGAIKAEKFIQEAIAENPSCDLWHFILAKNLRRQRRFSSYCPGVSALEIESLEKAYELFKNPMYEIFLARMYREMKKYDDARKMYESAFDKKPDNISILLKLALGFIRLKDLDKANECFKKIKQRNCKGSTYYHYRGLFYVNKNNFQKAKMNFSKAIEDNYNLNAEKDYIKSAIKVDSNYPVTDRLLEVLKKYKDFPSGLLQPVLLDLAIIYWKKENNIDSALKYFLKAVEIDPKAKCLENYYDYINIINNRNVTKERNIFYMLTKYIFPIINGQQSRYRTNTISRMDKLKKYTDDYYSSRMGFLQLPFDKLQLNK